MRNETSELRPYIVRAVYAWIVDNNLTPYIAVDTTISGVRVPKQYIANNSIVLNIAAECTNKLLLGDKAIEFQARFSGIIHTLFIPMNAVVAIYAKENNRGMTFEAEEQSNISPAKPVLNLVTSTKPKKQIKKTSNPNKRPLKLRVVKGGKTCNGSNEDESA